MKTFSTISHDAVRNHQTNNSPTKVAFKFSQTKRFKDPNPEYFLFLFLDVQELFINNLKTYLNFLKEKLLSDMDQNLISLRRLLAVHRLLNITLNQVYKKPN